MPKLQKSVQNQPTKNAKIAKIAKNTKIAKIAKITRINAKITNINPN